MNRIQIKNDKPVSFGTKILINGKKVRYVHSLNFSVSVDEVPTAKIEMQGAPDIDVLADVILDISPDNLQSACQIIKDELLKHGDFFKAFVSSVQSAIREVPEECWSNELAEKIVKRISGEE